jgi:hypothetical protein
MVSIARRCFARLACDLGVHAGQSAKSIQLITPLDGQRLGRSSSSIATCVAKILSVDLAQDCYNDRRIAEGHRSDSDLTLILKSAVGTSQLFGIVLVRMAAPIGVFCGDLNQPVKPR